MIRHSLTKPKYTLTSLLLTCSLFTACSNAPSENAIFKAYAAEIETTNAIAKKTGAPLMGMQLKHLHKHKCTLINNQSMFRCQVDIELLLSNGETSKFPTTLLLEKNNEGAATHWIINRTEAE